MPPRIHIVSSALYHAIEGGVLGLLALTNGVQYLVGVISESDWQRITGPHAFLFGLIIAVLVLWNSGRVREANEKKRQERQEILENERREKEEKARDDRHAELVKTQRENAESLKALTVESIKAVAKSTHAIETLDRNIQRLTIATTEKQSR